MGFKSIHHATWSHNRGLELLDKLWSNVGNAEIVRIVVDMRVPNCHTDGMNASALFFSALMCIHTYATQTDVDHLLIAGYQLN